MLHGQFAGCGFLGGVLVWGDLCLSGVGWFGVFGSFVLVGVFFVCVCAWVCFVVFFGKRKCKRRFASAKSLSHLWAVKLKTLDSQS